MATECMHMKKGELEIEKKINLKRDEVNDRYKGRVKS